MLSYEVGYVKPDAGYFRALLRHIDDPHAAAFVDDKPGNVDAAREHGLDGWIHIDVGVTAARIEEIVGRHRR
ncbi:MAG: hypothetical protein ACRDRA_11325 [Pseudonocardiaceae bacterium]